MLTEDKAPEPKPMNDSSDPTKGNKKALSDRPSWEMTFPTPELVTTSTLQSLKVTLP